MKPLTSTEHFTLISCLSEKLLKESKGLNKEESKEYTKILDKLSTPTGRNIFDFYKEDDKKTP